MDRRTRRIIYWNAHGLKANIVPLKSLLKEPNADIASISETLLGNSDKFKMAQYITYRQDKHMGQRPYRGLAVQVQRMIYGVSYSR